MTVRQAIVPNSAAVAAAMCHEAFASLSANRLRTGLTMLGIVVGVSAVIVLLAVSAGFSAEVEKKLNELGGELLFIHSEVGMRGLYSGGAQTAGSLTLADAEAIGKLPGIERVAPFVDSTLNVTYDRSSWQTYVVGTVPAFLDNRSWPIAAGARFNDADVRSARAVVLLGHSVALRLFGDSTAVGNTVRLNRAPFQVLGVLEKKGRTAAGDQDDCIILPLRALQLRVSGSTRGDRVRAIQAAVRSRSALTDAVAAIQQLLRTRHRIHAGSEDDFGVTDMTAASAALSAAERDRFLMLGAIGSISLLVGGIGIMNVLLVSIAERTREIALRKALGATNAAILMQFLAESVVLALAGCALGVALGVGAAWVFTAVAGVPTKITVPAVLVAVTVSTLVGLIAGWFPASRAAKMPPTIALRQT
jgi:putative ABC transport system permease protein